MTLKRVRRQLDRGTVLRTERATFLGRHLAERYEARIALREHAWVRVRLVSGREIRIEVGEREVIGQLARHSELRGHQGWRLVAKAPDGSDRELTFQEHQFPWSWLGAWAGGRNWSSLSLPPLGGRNLHPGDRIGAPLEQDCWGEHRDTPGAWGALTATTRPHQMRVGNWEPPVGSLQWRSTTRQASLT